jgi:hypothetical protein
MQIVRKVTAAVALLLVGGLVIGGTMAFAGDSPSPSASVASTASASSASEIPSIGDDDGTADQGHGDVPVAIGDLSDGGLVSGDDDGTPDQGPGDFSFGDDDGDDRDDDADDDDDVNDDNSGPSENSGPGSVDDDSEHDDDTGHGSDD